MKKNVAEQLTEEITRSSCLSSVSLVLGCVMPVLRQAAGRGCWEILSSFDAEVDTVGIRFRVYPELLLILTTFLLAVATGQNPAGGKPGSSSGSRL